MMIGSPIGMGILASAGSGGSAPSAPAMVLVRDTFLAGGTWTAPASLTSPDGTANAVDLLGIGNGGGGKTNEGSGGGGEGRKRTNYPVTPSTGYTVTIPATAIDTNGGNITFDTTGIVIAGGLSKANGGTGGTGGSGGTGFAGGNGVINTGTRAGGASAGTESAASGTNPGDPEGSLGAIVGTLQSGPGTGGASAAADQRAGLPGFLAVEYRTPAVAGYARRIGHTFTLYASAATSHTLVLPGAGPGHTGVGDLLIVLVPSEATAAAFTATGWTQFVTQTGTGSRIVGLWIVDNGAVSTTLNIDSSILPDDVHVYRYRNAGTPEATSASNSLQTATPAITFDAAGKHVVLSCAFARDNTAMSTSGGPSGYRSVIYLGRKASSRGHSFTAEKEVDSTGETPGAWTFDINSAGTRVTIAIPFAP